MLGSGAAAAAPGHSRRGDSIGSRAVPKGVCPSGLTERGQVARALQLVSPAAALAHAGALKQLEAVGHTVTLQEALAA